LRGKRTTLIAVVAVAVVAIGVGAFVVLRSGGTSNLSGQKALVTVRDLVDRAKLTGQGSAQMSDCPIGNLDKLVAMAPAAVGDVARKASKSPEDDQVYQSDSQSEPPIVQCFYLTSDEATGSVQSQVGVFAAAMVDGNYHSYLRGVFSVSTLHFEPDQSYRGGTEVDYCGDAAGDNGFSFCESDWHDSSIQVGVFITGDGQSVQLTGDWLRAALPSMLHTLEGDHSDIDVSPPTT
jgi:hypothetical protein